MQKQQRRTRTKTSNKHRRIIDIHTSVDNRVFTYMLHLNVISGMVSLLNRNKFP